MHNKTLLGKSNYQQFILIFFFKESYDLIILIAKLGI